MTADVSNHDKSQGRSSPSGKVDHERIQRAMMATQSPPETMQNQQFISLGSSLGVVHTNSAANIGEVSMPSAGAKSIESGQQQEPNTQESFVEDELIFESAFDLTEEWLRNVFSTFDTDEDGKVDYECLRKGLEDFQTRANSTDGTSATLSVLDDMGFQELVSFLDSDRSGDITFEEFSEGFRLLMLRVLIYQPASSFEGELDAAPMDVLDYDSTRLERILVGATPSGKELPHSYFTASNNVTHNLKAEEFYFQSRQSWVRTRWIDVISTSGVPDAAIALTMKRLAVKYSLHPLALEDALSSDTHQPKVEVFSNHYLLIIPSFSIMLPPQSTSTETSTGANSSRKRRKLFCFWPFTCCGCSCCKSATQKTEKKKKRQRQNQHPQIHIGMVSLFVNVPHNDTIITFNKKSDSYSSGNENEFPHNHQQHTHLFRRVQKELNKRYSKLRQYDAQYLTYALLDHAVDLLRPVIKTMRNEIIREKDDLRDSNYTRGLARINSIKEELEKVCRRLRPFGRVLTHTIEDDAIVPGATVYLRDVRDNLECAEDDIRQLIEQCDIVNADADKFRARQMDQTLYVLTVISAVFLPAQFLTGVWGMNFIDMPELQRDWGYPLFWIITVIMTTSLLVVFYFLRVRNIEGKD